MSEKVEICNNNIDKEVVKLKLNVKELEDKLSKLQVRLEPVIQIGFSSCPGVDCMETKGKLDSELFNVNQSLELMIENIINIEQNIMTKGDFNNEK